MRVSLRQHSTTNPDGQFVVRYDFIDVFVSPERDPVEGLCSYLWRERCRCDWMEDDGVVGGETEMLRKVCMRVRSLA